MTILTVVKGFLPFTAYALVHSNIESQKLHTRQGVDTFHLIGHCAQVVLNKWRGFENQ